MLLCCRDGVLVVPFSAPKLLLIWAAIYASTHVLESDAYQFSGIPVSLHHCILEVVRTNQ